MIAVVEVDRVVGFGPNVESLALQSPSCDACFLASSLSSWPLCP